MKRKVDHQEEADLYFEVMRSSECSSLVLTTAIFLRCLDRRRAKEEHDLGSSQLSIASAAVWSACGLELKTLGARREMLTGEPPRALMGTRMTRRGFVGFGFTHMGGKERKKRVRGRKGPPRDPRRIQEEAVCAVSEMAAGESEGKKREGNGEKKREGNGVKKGEENGGKIDGTSTPGRRSRGGMSREGERCEREGDATASHAQGWTDDQRKRRAVAGPESPVKRRKEDDGGAHVGGAGPIDENMEEEEDAAQQIGVVAGEEVTNAPQGRADIISDREQVLEATGADTSTDSGMSSE